MTSSEDVRVKKPASHTVGEDISLLSVAEIDRRIVLLEEEIMRLKQERLHKDKSRSAAEALFSK